MPHYVYAQVSVIPNKKGMWVYSGSTSNIEKRFEEHESGKTKSTKGYRPLKMVHIGKFSSREEAYERELFLKSGFGREEKNNLIQQSEIV